MLLSNSRLLNAPVMSLQTGAELARTSDILVDPRNLMVLAYELEGAGLDERPSFLLPSDVRELSNLGFIVDSSDEFVGLDDVIKLKEVYEYKFSLIGIDVIDDKRRKIGKTISFTIDADTYSVQQITVKRPLLKSFSDAELLIHRSQIIEVTNEHIIVRSKAPVSHKTSFREYANPFRPTNVQPEAIEFESRWNYSSDSD